MSLRGRVTLATGVAVLVVVVAVSTAVYLLVRQDLRDRIDTSLNERADSLTLGVMWADRSPSRPVEPYGPAGDGPVVRLPEPDDERVGVDEGDLRVLAIRGEEAADNPLIGETFHVQVIRDDQVVASSDQLLAEQHRWELPLTEATLAVAEGKRENAFFDTQANGTPVRSYVVPAGDGTAIQVSRSLEEVQARLDQLVVRLLAISVVGLALATGAGALVAAAAVAPVHRLSSATRAVARTGDLSHHVPVTGGDELADLARSFNTMLDSLEESLRQQRQLVADASHELRTPLASIRTNVEVLQRAGELGPGERQQLLQDIVGQIAELTSLVENLVELARGDTEGEPRRPVDLDRLVSEVIERARRRHPSVAFELDLAGSTVQAAPGRMERAITNLVDNAVKWSPADGTVTVSVAGTTISVRDEGPGVDPADLPHIFDRFYRSPAARGMPGSGLGLAIVKQVAEQHEGAVTVEAPPSGGTLFALTVPPASGEEPAAVTGT